MTNGPYRDEKPPCYGGGLHTWKRKTWIWKKQTNKQKQKKSPKNPPKNLDNVKNVEKHWKKETYKKKKIGEREQD